MTELPYIIDSKLFPGSLSPSWILGSDIKISYKKDKDFVINGKVLCVNENKITFIDLDFPDGICSMTKYSISKYWDIVEVK
jgi:hypothetical protein